jgi:DNA-binding MarR family transcriptional regulator
MTFEMQMEMSFAMPDTEFIDKTGAEALIHHAYAPAFFALIASRITERILASGTGLAGRRGISVPGRSMSSLLLLKAGPMSVTEIAATLKVTHAASIKNVRALLDAGLVERRDDPGDARRKPLHLTEDGMAEAERVDAFMRESGAVYAEIFEEVGVDIHAALLRMEAALDRKDFAARFEG